MTLYGKRGVAKIVGLPVRTIEYYTKIGLPDVSPPGRGRANDYSKQNVIEFAMIKVLRELKFELKQIKEMLDFIRDEDPGFYRDGVDRELVYQYSKIPALDNSLVYLGQVKKEALWRINHHTQAQSEQRSRCYHHHQTDTSCSRQRSRCYHC